MSTDIYYFSGTGNSLFIANKLGEKIADSRVISIPNVINHDKPVTGDVIGIVCPIYMYNMPLMVADFVRKIKEATYIFFVYAGAGKLGSGTKATQKLFREQNLNLSSLFNIPMPSNYSPFGATSPQRQAEMFGNVDGKIEQIVEIVNAQKEHIDHHNCNFFEINIHPGIVYRMGYQRIPTLDKDFFLDGECNGCGICQKVCPVNNVAMEDGKPVWNGGCQHCYACLQWCPQEAIQGGKNTASVKRYHHPNVKVKEIIAASSAGETV